MKALISIDYTNDFVADDGALTAGKPAQNLHAKILELTKQATEQQDFVVYAIDRHTIGDEYHPESRLFPAHNLAGTNGRQLFGALQAYYEKTADQANVYYMDKRHYSAFAGTDLDLRLRERKITEITLVGVCTDICVLHTAIDAYNLGYQINVPEAAVASFDAAGHAWALQHLKNTLGANIIEEND
ncbi:cysteine hydrolase [Weissella diestrammenae]|uniref:Cysteine hydrolase n=1 Tax=Weissella diestrammenae TaxID=1162633 RepID=A0A7G9T5U5_9LACO|nr:isochorismatase family cysteine hydrolase [Weissella diestrammenae]MCM0582300.1 cysteine hydrolase [Weissella diestrammenae]QNN75470.1 cysteine hydrolase [Weissella diestrammenae]